MYRSVDRPADLMDPESSMDLLEASRLGNADALNRLLHRYMAPLRSWASRGLPRWARDLEDSQDIVQGAVLKCLHHLSDFEPSHDGGLHGYLRTAVTNQIRDAL